MATLSLISTIVVFLIIATSTIEGQYFPKIERFISKPDSDLDDYDLPPSPLDALPLGLPPMPFVHHPFLGGMGSPIGVNPLTRLFPNPFQHQNPYLHGLGIHQPHRREEIYTAVGYDRMDPNSQMRITITERRPHGHGMVNPILGGPFLPGMGFDDDLHVSYDAPTNWYVQGAFLGSQLRNKVGTYHLVLTESGRTADGCVSESLGRIVSSGIIDIANPFLQNSAPSGVAANSVLVGNGGPTVYASTLEGVTRRQLVGAGLAACQSIHNGICGGYIPFCATVSKDLLPALEVPLTTNPAVRTTITFDPFDLDDFDLQQGGVLQAGAGDGIISFAEEDRSLAYNSPQALARQGQQTEPSKTLGLLF